MVEEIVLRPAQERDLPAIASINALVFLGDRDQPDAALEWASCWFRAFPLCQYFVIEVDGAIAGYAGWQIHGGFHRSEPVIELDQVGVNPKYQGRRLATRLMRECMYQLVDWIKQKNDRIESHVTFVVWGYSLNFNAISVYAKEFGDGICGFRTQFGSRAESMFRIRIPIVRQIREE